jgi:hypothetical protein
MEMRLIFLFAPAEICTRAALRGGVVACNIEGRTMGVAGDQAKTSDGDEIRR